MRTAKLQGLLISALLCSVAVPASAASTLLLQLGNAETKEDAYRMFGELQAKYPSLLGKYRVVTRQVTNSNDISSWRVQAGKIENRGRANRICAELKDAGEECFIVETAAIKNDDMVEVPPVAANKPASSESDSFFNFGFGKSEEQKPDIAEKEEAPPVAEDKRASNVFTSRVSGPPPRVAAPKTVSYEINEVVSWGLFGGEKPHAKDEPKPVRVAERVEKPKPAPAPLKDEPAETPAPEAEKKENGGFFSWLSGDEEKVEKPKEPVTIAEAKAQSKSNINKESAKAEPKTVEPEPAPPPPPPPAPEPEIKIEPSPLAVSGGKVEVAEAIPVPLSAGAGRQTAFNTTRVETNFNSESQASDSAPASGMSSEGAAPQRWMQISNFSNEMEATACSPTIRAAATNVSNLRVQLVKNLWLGSRSRISLRVGPLPSDDVADAVCQAAKICNPGVECRGVGQATVTSPTPRYAARKPVNNNAVTSVYWAQLGSLPSRAAAAERYAMLQSANRDALGKYEMMISEAQTSGTSATLYRLRVGPFLTSDAAQKICAKLKSRGTSCIVVSE